MDAKYKLTAERLREVLSYNPETGEFHWLKSSNNFVKVGEIAGKRLNSSGYKDIQIDGVHYRAHRLAWLYVYGVWPDGEVDHINCIRTDNRIANLRDVPDRLNSHNRIAPSRNNTSGYLGVTKKKDGRYQASIRIGGKRIHLGSFSDPKQAHEAYLAGKRKYHEGAIHV